KHQVPFGVDLPCVSSSMACPKLINVINISKDVQYVGFRRADTFSYVTSLNVQRLCAKEGVLFYKKGPYWYWVSLPVIGNSGQWLSYRKQLACQQSMRDESRGISPILDLHPYGISLRRYRTPLPPFLHPDSSQFLVRHFDIRTFNSFGRFESRPIYPPLERAH